MRPDVAQFPVEAPLESLRYVVLDTEFTSLDKRTNRLLSIGAVAMDGSRLRMGEQFYRVLNAGVAVPASTAVVHKLRTHDVEQGEAPAPTLEALQQFVAGAVLVGHFVGVDLDILRRESAQYGNELKNPAVDTARVHRWLVRHGRHSEDLFHRLENVDLATLARTYKVDFRGAHHALDDAFATARLWQKMMAELGRHDVRTWKQLQRIGGHG